MRFLIFTLGILLSATVNAMPSSEYLPDDANLDTSIPSPESVFGWEPGDWRVHHPDLVHYLRTLAENSERVTIKTTGQTYEQRPLLQLIITSVENQSRIEELRDAHLKGTLTYDPNAPLVVWLGYSVHGNEASGANAAPIIAWYLAASRSQYVEELLKNTIIIIDPSLNPDGLDRFASWSNSNRSVSHVSDTNGRIHNQDWPQGRTNHYLFDLNRDWLPLVHPESQARIREYHRWLPHVITDHHETGTDGYFFQPGVPTRQHPLTTQENLDLTRKLATFHARSLDQAGTMYFTEDFYDDFYYGKGSTYPDINGSIGILFEQPRVDGPVRDRGTGQLTFSDAIHNQVRTSLSTLEGAQEISDDLKKYQPDFFKAMSDRSSRAGFKAWVIGDNNDHARAQKLMDVFKQHEVDFLELKNEINAEGQVFTPGHAWIVPVNQRQFGLAQAMLEVRTEFEDNTFYDVSAWNLAMAYDLPFARLSRLPSGEPDVQPQAVTKPVPDAVAWIIPWQQLKAPAILQDLLEANVRVRAASKPFSMADDSGSIPFAEGSLVVLSGIQDEGISKRAFEVLREASEQGVNVHSFNSQMSSSGPGLGTNHFKLVPAVQPLLIGGRGTSNYRAGEAWHQMDQRLGLPPVITDMNRLKNLNLSDYTHLLMVDGSYSDLGQNQKHRIANWVKEGGVLISTQRAAQWAESLCFEVSSCNGDQEDMQAEDEPLEALNYAEFDDQQAQRIIGGAIVSATVDNTHPVAYGYTDKLPIFRKGTVLLKASNNPFTTPVRYTEKPLLSGYIGAQRLAEMSGQPAVIAERHGKGLVVRFANNPLFRGFWRGTERLWVNALYFGPLVRSTNLPD